MSYSIISVLSLILNLIMNHDIFKNIRGLSKEQRAEQKAIIRYVLFLMAANCYFITDVLWGLLYERHENGALFPFLYITCVLYFAFMFLTMLMWVRYIVTYLEKNGLRSKVLLTLVWVMFGLAMVYLLTNFINPFMFSFNAAHEYVPEPGRHIAFLLQIVLYLMTSSYMFYIACKSVGKERLRHYAVGFTCFVMEIFLIIQIFNQNYPTYAMGLIIGICAIHAYVESGERKEKEVYDNIAKGLAEDYAVMYYIDVESGEFREYVASQEYKSMNVPVLGRNFYTETQENIDRFVHPDDREMARDLHQKETMLRNIKGRRSYSYKYRIMVNDQPRIFLFTLKLVDDGKSFVLYEKDIDDDIKAEIRRKESQEKQVTFSQIAESLAANYDVIYYVNIADSNYLSYECRNIYGQLDMKKSGDDFFADAKNDILQIVQVRNRDLALEFLDRDNLISTLDTHKSCSIDYRVKAGTNKHYVRMTVRKTSDGTHFIIGIENIDDEVKKEKQHLKALNTEKELARRDELTGVKNKTAYHELEKSVQENIDNGLDYLSFALVVCDTNDLKKINDTQGHVVGDEYIRESAKLLCDIFTHSPVFRVGGDEFVIFLRSSDFLNREDLMSKLREQVLENLRSGSGPIMASGMAEYDPSSDSFVTDIFDRADKEMYEDKQRLKDEGATDI